MVLSKDDWQSEGCIIWFSIGGYSCCDYVDWFRVNYQGSMNDLNEGDGNGILVDDECSCVLLMLVG